MLWELSEEDMLDILIFEYKFQFSRPFHYFQDNKWCLYSNINMSSISSSDNSQNTYLTISICHADIIFSSFYFLFIVFETFYFCLHYFLTSRFSRFFHRMFTRLIPSMDVHMIVYKRPFRPCPFVPIIWTVAVVVVNLLWKW